MHVTDFPPLAQIKITMPDAKVLYAIVTDIYPERMLKTNRFVYVLDKNMNILHAINSGIVSYSLPALGWEYQDTEKI